MADYFYRYSVPDYDQDDFEDAYKLKSTWSPNYLSYVAEDAGKDFFERHDGWESTWPLVIRLWYAGDQTLLGDFVVECEAVPSFSASKIKGVSDGD